MFGWFKRVIESVTPTPREIIHFDCRGCMAEDWREVERGVIVGRTSRVIYGSSRPVEFTIVRLPDGTEREYFTQDCMPGTAEMQPRTDNPNESLVGKWVYLR